MGVAGHWSNIHREQVVFRISLTVAGAAIRPLPSREPPGCRLASGSNSILFTVAPASVDGLPVQVPRSTGPPSASRPPAGGAASASTRSHSPARLVSGSAASVALAEPSVQVRRTTESPSASHPPAGGAASASTRGHSPARASGHGSSFTAPIRVAIAFSPCRRRSSKSPPENASVPCHRSK